MSQANLLTEWSWLLMESLAAAGVRDVIVSPGSRSTPFVAAAHRQGGLRCHDVMDERSAAFFALGQAKVRDRPSLLLCTSGTAAAHYFPAVVEAALSYTPLLLLTADRPYELGHCHAPQTMDQIKLYGDHVRQFFELGAPDGTPGGLRALRRIAAQAVHTSLFPLPGPVHLNARARKPLEPHAPADPEGEGLQQRVHSLAARPIVRVPLPSVVPDPETIREVAEECRRSERGLVVCGPAPLSRLAARGEIFELSRRLGYPLLVEGTSQLRFAPAESVLRVDLFEPILRSRLYEERLRPDLVLQIGSPPTSGAWLARQEEGLGVRRVVLAPWGWNDPSSDATLMLFGAVEETVRDLLERLEGSPPRRSGWLEDWERARACVAAVMDEELGGASEELTEPRAVRSVVESLPEGSLLAVGNSLPIRELDLYCPSSPRDVAVWCQRGVNGIDGLVSGACGAASVAGEIGRGPVGLLVGDVSFLHDLGGLDCVRHRGEGAMVIVVIHNDGGRIFEQLPLARSPELAEGGLEHWITPHGLSLEPAARLHGLEHRRVKTPAELREALRASWDGAAAAVVEVVVPPGSAAEVRRRVEGESIRRLAQGAGDLH